MMGCGGSCGVVGYTIVFKEPHYFCSCGYDGKVEKHVHLKPPG